jgi:Uncharacterized protein conserved in bacteria
MNTASKLSRPKMPRVLVDMDGVIVDFDAYRDRLGLTGEEVKARKSAYLDMEAIPGAIDAIQVLIGLGFDVWLATKPPTGVAHAYSDKAEWVFRNMPFLRRKIIITHHKGMLGSENDYLVDDRPHKASCADFAGTLVSFVDGYHWPQALEFFRAEAARLKGRAPQHLSINDAKRGEVARRLQEGNRHIDIVTARYFVDATLDLVEGMSPGGALRSHEAQHRLGAALERYQAMAAHLGGCTDGGCLIVRPTGMHTNGGCKCPEDKTKARRLLQAGQQLAGILAQCIEGKEEQTAASPDGVLSDGT